MVNQTSEETPIKVALKRSALYAGIAIAGFIALFLMQLYAPPSGLLPACS